MLKTATFSHFLFRESFPPHSLCFSSSGLTPRIPGTGTVNSDHIPFLFFSVSFFTFYSFGSFVRLSWLGLCQLLSARYNSLSYRIVMPVYLARVVTLTRLAAILITSESTVFAVAWTLDLRTYSDCKISEKETLVLKSGIIISVLCV